MSRGAIVGPVLFLRLSICPSLMMFLLIASAASGAVFVVHPDGSGPYPTIQAAVDAAGDDDTIELTDGVFQGEGNRDVEFGFKTLIFQSRSGSAAACTLSLGDRPFILQFEWATAVVRSLTFIHGRGASGTYANGSYRNCVFVECAGIIAGYCTLSDFTDCLFVGATGLQVYVGTESAAEFTRCVYRDGTAPLAKGPGITARDCLFYSNEADYLIQNGANPFFLSGDTSIERCRFFDNRCTDALLVAFVGLWGTSCTFAGNEGTAIYAGAWFSERTLEVSLTSCTFADNRGAGDAEISISLLSPEASAYLVLDRTILAFRDGGPALSWDEGCSVAVTCSDIYGNSGGDWTGCLAGLEGVAGNLSADPLFCRLERDPYVLQDDSPCLPDGGCDQIGAWGLGCAASGVADGGIPGAAILAWQPNPFRTSTRLALAGPLPADGRLEIFDAAGRRVRELLVPAGRSTATWDGRDREGRPVPAGVYFAFAPGSGGVGRPVLRVR